VKLKRWHRTQKGVDETADQRKSGFIAQLYEALAVRRESEPLNRMWQLARAFLEHPDLRDPMIHQRKPQIAKREKGDLASES
jgi:hypothetical protein